MSFENALQLATQKHAGQLRRDGTPYIWHPMAVAGLLRRAGFDQRYQITGLLHDLLEDTDTTEAEISAFGADVLEAVQLLTKRDGEDEAVYVERILNNDMAAMVKTSDRINNLLDAMSGPIGELRTEESKKFVRWYLKKSETYYHRKFCPALDETIGAVRLANHNVNYISLLPKWDFTTDFELYKNKEQRLLQARLAKKAASEIPDLENVEFFRIDDKIFCERIGSGSEMMPEKVWLLADVGWIETERNLWDYMEEMESLSDEEVEEIKKGVQ